MACDEGRSGADSGRVISAALFCRAKPDRRDPARSGLRERMGTLATFPACSRPGLHFRRAELR
jgi:hypothetical protein